MKITIEINTGNAAFEQFRESVETGRILKEVSTKLLHGLWQLADIDENPLVDINGNRVGSIKVTED